jgi:hypothetical protein
LNYTVNDIGVELYAKKAIGGGYLFCGVADEILISSTENVTDSNTATKTNDIKNTFYIPVRIEIGF